MYTGMSTYKHIKMEYAQKRNGFVYIPVSLQHEIDPILQ